MTDRELFQMALDCLENAVDLQQSEIDMHILHYGEWYRPQRVEFMKKYLNKTNQSIEAIRARLEQPWVKTYSGGKPNYTQPEQVAQFKFQEYGPPNWGESQVTTPEFVAEQEDMNEGLRKMVEQEPIAWMHISAVGNVYFRKKPQDAVFNPQPLYTAPPKKEWVGLTDAEIEGAIDEGFAFGLDDGNVSNKVVIRYVRVIEALLKEKNA